MAGSAIDTMLPSSGVMNAPTEVTAKTCHRRRSSSETSRPSLMGTLHGREIPAVRIARLTRLLAIWIL